MLDQKIDGFVLREGEYQRLALDDSGRYQSETFAGLWLDPEGLIRGDLAGVLATLRQGLDSPEHSDFVARLSAATG